jgi:hypothetical protein
MRAEFSRIKLHHFHLGIAIGLSMRVTVILFPVASLHGEGLTQRLMGKGRTISQMFAAVRHDASKRPL